MAPYKILILLSIITSFLPAQKFPDAEVDSILQKGINQLINHDYLAAKKNFNILDVKFPQLPLGKIYLAASDIIKSYDYAEDFNDEFIRRNLDEAIVISDSLLQKNDKNIWNFYFKALASGYYAYYSALKESWLNAFSYGINSAENYDKCLEENPDFFEAFIAAGNYKYWKSERISFLRWIPFVDDEREEGILLLEKAVENFSYNKFLAINSLIWIYINEKRFDDAINIAAKGLAEFPFCRIIKWGLGRAYEERDKKKSIAIYYEILHSYPEKLNGYNEVVLKHLIAQQYLSLNAKEKALDLCNQVLSKNLDPSIEEKLAERLARVNELRTELLMNNPVK